MIDFDVNPDNVVIKQDGQETRVSRRATIGTLNWVDFWERVKLMSKEADE